MGRLICMMGVLGLEGIGANLAVVIGLNGAIVLISSEASRVFVREGFILSMATARDPGSQRAHGRFAALPIPKHPWKRDF